MSGYVVGIGKPDQQKMQDMFAKIEHRGPKISGLWENNRIAMAQNYLEVEVGQKGASQAVPVHADGNENLRVCYDGQIGNWMDLAYASGEIPDPFPEEQLLLRLFKEDGERMFRSLSDAVFTFVISDGETLLAARDVLGIKTLFYGWKDDTLYLTSELKSLAEVTDDINEFPAGYYMDEKGQLTRFADLPQKPARWTDKDLPGLIEDIREIIQRSFDWRVDLTEKTGGLLSGGMDSSVITYLAANAYKKKFGESARFRTFGIGVGESQDIQSARVVSKHLGTDHHELIIDLQQLLDAIPDVIYYLESFDPSLVRSSISNYLVGKFAKEHGVDVLLSGEGGDEVFCGYTYLKSFPFEEMYDRQLECLRFLHSNASLRLDRMNQCHSLRVVTPLISGELLTYLLQVPPELKQKPEGDSRIEKWIFRKAYEPDLPSEIVWRTKQEFSQGSASADVLPAHFEKTVKDKELAEAKAKHPFIRSKEELYYFNIFAKHFGSGKAAETVGQWVEH